MTDYPTQYVYIDTVDLLILSYFDRVICLKSGDPTYQMANKSNCLYHINELKQILPGLRTYSEINQKLLVKLSELDIKILNSFNHLIYQKGHILKINQKGGSILEIPQSISYIKSDSFNQNLQTAIRFILKGIKLGAGLGAVVLSGGTGGDSIVALISATINSGLFLQKLYGVINNYDNKNIYLKKLLNIRMVEGPEQVRHDTLMIINEMSQKHQLDQLNLICPVILSLLDSVANIFGDWMSAFMPDTGGLIGFTITSIISSSQKNAYQQIANIYNKLPQSIQNLFINPSELEKFLDQIPQFIKDSITTEDNSFSISGLASRFIKSAVNTNASGLALLKYAGINLDPQQIVDFFNIYYQPQIANAVKVIELCFPLIFMILTVNEFCSQGTIPVTQQKGGYYNNYSINNYINYLKNKSNKYGNIIN